MRRSQDWDQHRRPQCCWWTSQGECLCDWRVWEIENTGRGGGVGVGILVHRPLVNHLAIWMTQRKRCDGNPYQKSKRGRDDLRQPGSSIAQGRTWRSWGLSPKGTEVTKGRQWGRGRRTCSHGDGCIHWWTDMTVSRCFRVWTLESLLWAEFLRSQLEAGPCYSWLWLLPHGSPSSWKMVASLLHFRIWEGVVLRVSLSGV